MLYLYLLIGMALLFVGGDFLVRGSVSLALKFQVSTLVIGLTVVAFATSAPELLVSLQAALDGHPDISFGNVIGSNIANIGLIMGLTAALFVLPVQKKDYLIDWIIMVAATILLYVLVKIGEPKLGFVSGAILTTLLVAYNYYKISASRRENKRAEELDIDLSVKSDPMWKVLGFVLLGILGLRFGASFFVEGAAGIALNFGVSERVISVTMVAFGTSVPELVASVIAARKNEKDLAIGNLLGSNIFNIMAVLGITSLITPIPVKDAALFSFDYWWMLGLALLVFPFMGLFTKDRLGRFEGLILLAAYVVYIVLTLQRM